MESFNKTFESFNRTYERIMEKDASSPSYPKTNPEEQGEALAQLATTTTQNHKNTTAYVHALEVQMSEIATLLANRSQGNLPSNPEKVQRARARNYLGAAVRSFRRGQSI